VPDPLMLETTSVHFIYPSSIVWTKSPA